VRLVSEGTAYQLGQLIERARLKAERAALAAAIPPDPTGDIYRNQDHQRRLQRQLDGLRQGHYRGDDPQLAEASRRLQHATSERGSVIYQRSWPGHARREMRRLTRELDRWTNAMELARAYWRGQVQPETDQLNTALDQLRHEERQLRRQHADLIAWWDQHPEAHGRIAAIDLRLGELDRARPTPPARQHPERQQRRLQRQPNLGYGVEHDPIRLDRSMGTSI
jgi:hypothetical protein